jgi:hypothetical protein
MKFTFPALLLLFLVSTFSLAQNITCGFDDNEISQEIMKQLPQFIKERKARKQAIDDFYMCRVVVDVDYQTFKKYNGDTLFIKNEVANMIQKTSEIYENEIGTKLVLTYVNIWKEEAKDPYNNVTDIFVMLTNLRNTYTNTSLSRIPNDLVMYLNSKGFSGAGGVASGKFNVSPWQNISTIAHEMGHNFGSPHTQSCTWPGGAIDFCYAVEGNCYSEALDNIKGTLMSYCNRRLNNFHPLCIELMNRNSVTRYQKIRNTFETIKLAETWDFNKDLYFSWSSVLQAETYLIEVADGADFKNIILRDTSEQAYTVLPFLKKNKNYFLRIKPKNRLGEGVWSNTMKLNTPAILETPQPLTALDGKINIDGTTLMLRFDKIDDATEYQLQTIGFSSGNTSYSFDLNAVVRRTTTNSFAMTTSSEGFTWRVRALRGSETSAWSKPETFWIKPNSSILDLTQQAINGYPLTFPINYTAGSGDILEVKVIVSENANYSMPIVNKILKSGIYASQINYPFLLQNLKPNTNYNVKFEEYNNDKFNIIGLPKGLVRFTERSFRTGSESNPTSFSYFNNGNIENLSRTLRKVVFNDNYAFVSTNEGIVQMKVDGTAGKLINRELTNGTVSNAVVDTKTDAAGNLWILTQVSKRIAFNGVFPKPTYRLAKLEPNTYKILESSDFVGSDNTAFNSFDPQTILVYDNRIIQKIIGDSTELVYQLPANVSLQQSMVWGKSSVWMLVYNSTSAINEIYNYNFEQKKQTIFNRTNTLLNGSISQIYLDAQENIWVLNGGTNLLLKYNKESGWVNQNLTLSGTNRIIGESNGVFYLYNIVGLKRDIYSFGENGLKLVENVPLVSTTGTIQLDNSGKIWLLQTDKLLKINPCNYLKTPQLKASSSQILKGEQVTLKAEGCSSAKWTWNIENKSSETQITNKNNVLLVNPALNTQYKVQCIDQECVSDLSNLLEINVLTLSLSSADKNKYCTNENIILKFVAGGIYTTKNEFRAIFSNLGKKYTATIANDNSFKAAIPREITSGKYWVKVESTEPKLTSTDSVEVQIFKAPTISISGLNEAYVLDTTQVLVKLTGTPPYKFVYNGKESVSSMNNTVIRSFVPSDPINYNFYVSEFSDTNCASGVIENREINIRATVNPKVSNFWVKYFPIPFDDVLDLQVYNKPGPLLTVTLFNTKGKMVVQKEFPIGSYLDKFKLDTTDLSAGLYFLVLDTGKRKEIKKVVKW